MRIDTNEATNSIIIEALFAFLLQVSHITKFHAALSLLSDISNFLSFWNLPQTSQIPVIMAIILVAVRKAKLLCYKLFFYRFLITLPCIYCFSRIRVLEFKSKDMNPMPVIIDEGI
jgi:hypothetical protein